VIDALTGIDGASNNELSAFTGLSVGAVSRACSQLERRGLIHSDRDGLTKRRYLADDWLELSFEQVATMRTNGLELKRRLAYHDSNVKHINRLLEKGGLSEREIERLAKRRERHLVSWRALTAGESPEVAADEDLADIKRNQAATSERATAPGHVVGDPLSSAWREFNALVGRSRLTGWQLRRLRQLDDLLGAGHFASIEAEREYRRSLRKTGATGKMLAHMEYYAELAAAA
jgi:DNA-binding MarR family transcriptional regulator